jgi:dihydrofolate reductase
MKLTTTTFVSVDGVMQWIGGPDEDRSGGFKRGGWTVPHFDKETATFVEEVYGRAEAFLRGRRTYEIFAASWGAMADPGDNPIGVALNTLPKYVASTTLTDPRWANTTVLSNEVAVAVGELKTKPGRASAFYKEVLDLKVLMDLGWIRTYGSGSKMTIQISVMSEGGSGTAVPIYRLK